MLVNEIETAQFMEIVICFMIRFLLPITGKEKRGENLLTENNGRTGKNKFYVGGCLPMSY